MPHLCREKNSAISPTYATYARSAVDSIFHTKKFPTVGSELTALTLAVCITINKPSGTQVVCIVSVCKERVALVGAIRLEESRRGKTSFSIRMQERTEEAAGRGESDLGFALRLQSNARFTYGRILLQADHLSSSLTVTKKNVPLLRRTIRRPFVSFFIVSKETDVGKRTAVSLPRR